MESVKSILRRLQQSRPSSSITHNYCYPSAGRWLWSESQRRREHTREFDLKALKHVVSKTVGSTSVSATVHVEKFAEGASNRIFRATVNHKRVIVKIPDPIVPPRLTTASEVATLEFLRSELGLPVPQVFSWSDDSRNPVGSEYIIMEEALGQALNNVWAALGIEAKISVVDQILSMQKRLIAAADMFKGYGSLYFSDDVLRLGLPRSFPVSSTAAATTTKTQAARFSLSVLAHRHFTNAAVAASDVLCGPWSRVEDYLISVAQASIVQLKTSQDQEAVEGRDRPFSFPIDTASDTSRSAQTTMLELSCMAIPQVMPRASEQRLPLIWHGDLHLGNIFVSPDGKITSIVDWQDTKVLPLFLQARMPPFLDLDADLLLWDLPDNFSDLPEPRRTDVWERFRQSMLQQCYLTGLKEEFPGLVGIIEDAQQTSIRRQIEVFAQVSRGQDADALLLRETLLRIQRHWPALAEANTDDAIPCPISIVGEELIRHQQDGRRYNEFQDLLKARQIPVADDGWVRADEFTKRRADLLEAIEEVQLSLDVEELVEFRKRLERWNVTG